MPARWRRLGEKGKKTKKISAAPYSVHVRNRRKFGVAATCAGRDINEKPKTAC